MISFCCLLQIGISLHKKKNEDNLPLFSFLFSEFRFLKQTRLKSASILNITVTSIPFAILIDNKNKRSND